MSSQRVYLQFSTEVLACGNLGLLWLAHVLAETEKAQVFHTVSHNLNQLVVEFLVTYTVTTH